MQRKLKFVYVVVVKVTAGEFQKLFKQIMNDEFFATVRKSLIAKLDPELTRQIRFMLKHELERHVLNENRESSCCTQDVEYHAAMACVMDFLDAFGFDETKAALSRENSAKNRLHDASKPMLYALLKHIKTTENAIEDSTRSKIRKLLDPSDSYKVDQHEVGFPKSPRNSIEVHDEPSNQDDVRSAQSEVGNELALNNEGNVEKAENEEKMKFSTNAETDIDDNPNSISIELASDISDLLDSGGSTREGTVSHSALSIADYQERV